VEQAVNAARQAASSNLVAGELREPPAAAD
jgi:hypothetical protein